MEVATLQKGGLGGSCQSGVGLAPVAGDVKEGRAGRLAKRMDGGGEDVDAKSRKRK